MDLRALITYVITALVIGVVVIFISTDIAGCVEARDKLEEQTKQQCISKAERPEFCMLKNAR